MKTLYLVSTKAFAGKTLFAFTLAKDAQQRGSRVRYFKPVGPYPALIDGINVDKDACYLNRYLDVDAPIDQLCPVPMTDDFQSQILAGTLTDQLPKIKAVHQQIAGDTDVLIAGGIGALFSCGCSFDLPAWRVADAMDARVLVVSRYKPDRTLDELFAAAGIFGDRLAGTIINAVPPTQVDKVQKTIVACLERRNIPVFGVMPEETTLHAIPVRELERGLNARVLVGENALDELVENVAIGAMSQEAAFKRFQRIPNKVVITGSDRSDIICCALETSTKALIVTGGLEPSPIVLSAAYERNVPVLLVREDTFTTTEHVTVLFEHLRFSESKKLEMAVHAVRTHIDLDRLWATVGITHASAV